MIALQRTARVIATVLVEAATVLALVAIGRRPELSVPAGHLGTWLRDGDPATVVVALLRWIALLGAGWLLVSTLLYVAASVSRVPAAVRVVRWSTVPAVRRAVDAACAVSVATSLVLAPAAAGAARASDPPVVSVVRDGRGSSGGIAELPPDTTAPSTAVVAATAPPSSPSPPVTAPAPLADDDVVVVEGDNLWVLAAEHLAAASGRTPADLGDDEVARYWVRVCDTNRERLASGDPDLVFPGEHVLLPPVQR